MYFFKCKMKLASPLHKGFTPSDIIPRSSPGLDLLELSDGNCVRVLYFNHDLRKEILKHHTIELSDWKGLLLKFRIYTYYIYDFQTFNYQSYLGELRVSLPNNLFFSILIFSLWMFKQHLN